MRRDELFRNRPYEGSFRFDENTAAVFEDMLLRSVPLYQTMQELTVYLAVRFAKSDTIIYDLGCSKGTLCRLLRQSIPDLSIGIVGMDCSAPMIQGAIGLTPAREKDKITFLQEDVTQASFAHASVIIACLTLQFLSLQERERLVQRVYESLYPGGAMILFEKTENKHPLLRQLEVDVYYNLKARNGYSQQEILGKREALKGILLPLSDERNQFLLQRAGFSLVSMIFKWMNFSGYLAIKQVDHLLGDGL